jgi:hypothetical protein
VGEARRVRVVRLRAADDGLVRRGAALLEDALRTATLPGTDGGRVWVVRSLRVGRIHPDAPPAAVALQLGRAFARVRAEAVHADDPAAATAGAVWFRDGVEARALLAVRLVRGGSAAEWFWPSAVRGWRPGRPPADVLRAILSGVPDEPAVVVVGAALLGALLDRGAIDGVLAVLNPDDGPVLLARYGWAIPTAGVPDAAGPQAIPPEGRRDRPAPPRSPAEMQAICSEWRAVLVRWVGRWTPADPRSVWLAAMATIAARAPRALDSRLPLAARALAGWFAAAAESPEPLPAAVREAAAPHTAPGVRPPVHGAGDVCQVSAAARDAPRDVVEGAPPDARHPTRGSAVSGSGVPSEPVEGVPSGFAGLFLLLAALERLGIGPWLTDHPAAVEADFPARLLDAAADALGAPADDPVRGGWERATPGPLGFDFTAPARWRPTLCRRGPWVVRPVRGEPGVRVVTDRSRVLALARWVGPPPPVAAALRRERRIVRGTPLDPRVGRPLPVASWLAALARWCRRFARVGAAAIARRPGRVAVTRTHLDIVFDHRQADIRVRRAGLDLDPGWLPWLGKVVRFHYRFGGPADGHPAPGPEE